MKRSSVALLALAMSSPLLADPPAQVMNILREPDLKFVQSKMNPGISQAVISGNPVDPGKVYVVRNRSRRERSARRTSIPRHATSRC
ncbi:MAG TPA: hypothetical protein VF936_18030 [Burkholderiales bacterium]